MLLRRLFLMFAGLLLAVVPFLTSLLVYGGMPPGFGIFPPQYTGLVPGFNLAAFIVGCIIVAGISIFLIFPQWFGFGPAVVPPIVKGPHTNFPWWFWPGVVLWIFFWALMWGQWPVFGSLVHYTFVPMWWGFILTIDGIVYKRLGGGSLIAKRPLAVFAIAVSSCFGWYFFEYLDYFVFSNWYYPINTIFTTLGYILWYGLAYTTVMPSIFEWYNLLTTFDFWRKRYANGPKITLARWVWWAIFGLGVVSLAALVKWPAIFFSMVWISPLLLLTSALHLMGYWTPFKPIEKGNWSMALLMAIGCLFNYFLGEMWNYWSPPGNPNFWMYDVPFVNVAHIFEMPFLGFFGYLPFGVMCWVWWIQNASILNANPDIEVVPTPDGP